MLRVGFDGRDLLRKRTGVVNNAVHLARLLAKRTDAEFVVYGDDFFDPAVGKPDVSLHRLKAPPILWKHAMLPLALARDRIDLFHSPTGTLPLVAPCRQVVTMHDLFAAIEPTWFPPRMAMQLRASQSRAARKADRVIAVSECTRRDLIERFGIDEHKVDVVHNGIDHERLKPLKVDSEAIAWQFGVPYPFVLCVGSLMPWRNAPRLVRAVARLQPLGLLFVGRDIWGTDPTQRLATHQQWDFASFAGYIRDEDLPTLYSAASVFAYPSLYEGFGIPPLEAMACGTPVVASTAGALPEVLGDAALLVDPYDEDALTQAIDAARHDAGDLRRRGLARAAAFSWERTAEQTWQVYQAAAAR